MWGREKNFQVSMMYELINRDNEVSLGEFFFDSPFTHVNDDEKGTKAHGNKVNNQDNTKINGSDDTLVMDDERATESYKNKVEEKCNKPKRKPTEVEERKMIGKARELLVVSCLKNHVYKFGNQLKMKSAGGPIGLGLTGEV